MDIHRRWLAAAGLTTAVVGVAITTGGVFPSALGLDALATALFWPEPANEAALGDPGRLGMVIAGAVMAGFGVLIWKLAQALDDLRVDAVTSAIASSLLTWFVVDCTGSLAVGATLNVVGNTLFLALLLPPALLLRRGAGELPQT